MNQSFAERLRAGEHLLGTIVTLPSPEAAELLALCGYDWLFIDLEHGPADILTAQRMLQAARCPCLVRVADSSKSSIERALDIGATGVIVPGIRSAAEVERVVSASRYPPAGMRGVGPGRAHDYGLNFTTYLSNANDEIVVVPQIEHVDAVRDIEEIALVSGVSALFVGPFDLSASLGYPGAEHHADTRAAIGRVRQVCEEAGRRLGIFASDADSAAHWLGAGFTLVAVATDVAMLSQRARDIVHLLR